MPKITLFEVKKNERKYLEKRLSGNQLRFYQQTIDKIDTNEFADTEVLSVFIYSKVTKEVMEKLPNLKAILTRSTGFDHIDINTAKEKGIKVYNVPSYGENTVAEHTFALILSLSRHIHKSYVRTLKNDFSIEGLIGFDLRGKTIGIVGGGKIGMHVAKIAKGFGMNVLVYDAYRNKFLEEVIGFKYVSLSELLKQSDIVSLHVPYNQSTHHMINRDTLGLMKKGAILINTARGGVVDTDALLEALESKKLGGAGLDVIEGEELIREEHQLLHDTANPEKLRAIYRDHKIFQLENVVFTPHNAFNSKEALLRILDTTVENLHHYLDGKDYNRVV
ncbi:MAG: NAD(P)-binding domain-containing protein [Candidatus Micrarchaeota archaeon]|nr:NAD(P)-binding domain-containing protein [Candidatus Micrarchaeota archaeon]